MHFNKVEWLFSRAGAKVLRLVILMIFMFLMTLMIEVDIHPQVWAVIMAKHKGLHAKTENKQEVAKIFPLKSSRNIQEHHFNCIVHWQLIMVQTTFS